MAIPRSTLVVGLIALLSSSAVVYLLLHPRKIEEPPPEYTPAKPGALNPIAAKVLAEGGPRTPNAPGSTLGPRRGAGHLVLSLDAGVPGAADSCLSAIFDHARQQIGQTPSEPTPCTGSGPDQLEGQLVLAVLPAAAPRGVTENPTQAVCTATFRGSLSRAGQAPKSLTFSVGPNTGDPSTACDPLQSQLAAAFASSVTTP